MTTRFLFVHERRDSYIRNITHLEEREKTHIVTVTTRFLFAVNIMLTPLRMVNALFFFAPTTKFFLGSKNGA